MTPEKEQEQAAPEPRGFGEHTRGLSGEYAHEQGWGISVEERTRGPQNPDGGNDYEYGARDFGDEAVNVASAPDNLQTEEQSKKEGLSDSE